MSAKQKDMPVSSKSTAWPGPHEALAEAGIIARARFFCIHHPLAVSLAFALFIGIGGVAVFGYLNSIAMEGRAGLMLAYTSACFVNAAMGIFWLIASRRKVATAAHFAGAFAGASSDEKPHLVARLKARAASRITDEPVTTNELVSMFNSVRAEHGKRAKRRRKASAVAIAEQQEFLGQNSAPVQRLGNPALQAF